MGDEAADEAIVSFLDGGLFAVVGASLDRQKYGNKVLRCYQQNDREVVGVNPKANEVEGAPCFPDLESIDQEVHAVSIITPPAITERVVEDAARLGIEHVWMQPGAESDAAIARANELGLNLIAGGPCLLVVLGYRE